MLKLYLIILVVFLVSCEKSGIMTYKVPKQTISVAQLSVDKQINNIIWVIPETWIEQEKTQFRVSSYKVPFGDNPTIFGDFSVVKFPGDAGGVLANVNRWRDQLDLKPIGIDRLASLLIAVDHPFLSISFLELHSNKSITDTESMYVAFFIFNEHSYFFKLVGSSNVLAAHYDVFIGILKSIGYKRD